MKGKSSTRDAAMQVALNTYQKSVEAIAGSEKANETLAMILGGLLLEYISGEI